MYFYGELDHTLVADAIALLGRESAYGVLSCQNGSVFSQVTVSGGCVVGVLSNQPQARLGHSLVRRGILTEAEVERALKEQRRTERRLGEVLIDMGVMDRTSLAEELVWQASNELGSLFTWQQGQFVFQSKQVQVPADHLVWLETPPIVFRNLMETGSPLQGRIDLAAPVHVRRPWRSPSFSLLPDVKRVLRELAQDRSVEQLRQSSGLDQDRILRILSGLDVLGLVDLPLRSLAPPNLNDVVVFYRSVLRSIFLQTEAEKGGPGVHTFDRAWNSSSAARASRGRHWREAGLGAQPAVLPPMELKEEGVLRLSRPEEWGANADPDLLQGVATLLNSAALDVLMALKERFGPPLVDSVVANLGLTGDLLLRRNPALQKFLEARWKSLLSLPKRLKSSFEEGMDRFAAGDREAAAFLIGRVSPDHASFAEAMDALQCLWAAEAEQAATLTGLLDADRREQPKEEPAAAPMGAAAAVLRAESAAAPQPDAAAVGAPAPVPEADVSQVPDVTLLLRDAQALLKIGEVAAARALGLIVMSNDGTNAAAASLLAECDDRERQPPAADHTDPDRTSETAQIQLRAVLQTEAPVEEPPRSEPATSAAASVPAGVESIPASAAGDSTASSRGTAEHIGFLLREAQSEIEAGHFQTALGLYNLVLAMQPDNPPAKTGRSVSLYKLDIGEQVDALIEKSRLSQERGQTTEAMLHLERANKLDPERQDVVRRLQALESLVIGQIHQLYGGPGCRPKLRRSLVDIHSQSLDLNEGFIVSQIDGRTDLKTLTLISGLGIPTTYRIVLSLAERGLIELPLASS